MRILTDTLEDGTMKHTPGPWKLDESTYPHDLILGIRDSQNHFVAELSGFTDGGVVKADAQLISAAPELLTALERMLTLHARMMQDVNHGASAYQGETIQEMNEAPGQAEAAIAKATGK